MKNQDDGDQERIPCVIMRGGTSKGIFFDEGDLPSDPRSRERLILSIMGSPDPRQIDGLGGADPLTSKICIIGPGAAFDADCTYTFGQVGIDEPYVALAGNCGNLSAAVGVYAVEQGLAPAIEPETVVRIYNTNARQILIARVPVRDGRPMVTGDYVIAGVPGSGAEIRMDYSRTSGATTGSVLPTGRSRDRIHVAELGRDVEISIVDVAKATCFFNARDVGLTGTEGPDAFTAEILARFWAIRNAAARYIGLSPDSRLPTPVAVAEPAPYENYMTKEIVPAEAVSFVARRVIGPPPRLHKAFASTGAVCTAVASRLEGTIVHAVSKPPVDDLVRIGHPSGVFPVKIVLDAAGTLLEASYSRTARRIMEGTVLVPRERLRSDTAR
ncbi:2-methylaconitate cis-trans isomerase PrpF family protein [Microvirga antarctica]|uniref:2-methylaconitate cis-trans isomerase PrpF family protein n=1 Tax=Microvirga antarctica TaxID=2819233 RepID=UPI001B31715D|nr:PrpF domain-containing protein [Microvirga antarctica]